MFLVQCLRLVFYTKLVENTVVAWEFAMSLTNNVSKPPCLFA